MQLLIRALTILVFSIGFYFNAATASASTNGIDTAIATVQHAWAKANYQTPENQREVAFKALLEQAHQTRLNFPGQAEPMIWEAIVLSSYANVEGGLDALDRVKQARGLLLAAEKLDPSALNGSVYTSLGSLYYKVPGWPLSFGDNDQARVYLGKALSLNPNGIDPNFFLGDLLFSQEDYEGAAAALRRALSAPPRPGREVADSGRRAEIKKVLKEVEANL